MRHPVVSFLAVVALLVGGAGCTLLDDLKLTGETSAQRPGKARRSHRSPKASKATKDGPGVDVDGDGDDDPPRPTKAPRAAKPTKEGPGGDVGGDADDASRSPHLALGTPKDDDPEDDHLIVRKQYAVSYNHHRNGPNWASWRLVASDYGGQKRASHFSPDESLPEGWYRVKHEDYSNTGYDRGHLVRSEDRTTSRADNDATFLLTNVLPQRHGLNAGPWLRLEDQCRTLAEHDGRQLYVQAGAVWGDKPKTMAHGIAIPEAFWKVVIVLAPGQGPKDVTASTRVLAAVMPNSESPSERWEAYQVSLAEVERRSGYRLLDRVPENVRAALRAR